MTRESEPRTAPHWWRGWFLPGGEGWAWEPLAEGDEFPQTLARLRAACRGRFGELVVLRWGAHPLDLGGRLGRSKRPAPTPGQRRPLRPRCPWPPGLVRRLLDLAAAGVPFARIGETLGLTEASVYRKYRRLVKRGCR